LRTAHFGFHREHEVLREMQARNEGFIDAAPSHRTFFEGRPKFRPFVVLIMPGESVYEYIFM
jgi:hypothetical protein